MKTVGDYVKSHAKSIFTFLTKETTKEIVRSIRDNKMYSEF